jgi:TPR repeat protein
MKRVKANDPLALYRVGGKFYNEGDFKGAVEYWTKATTLGDLDAHHGLAQSYHEGEGVEKNEKKGSLSFGRGSNWWSS